MPTSVHQKGEPVTSNAESAIEQCQRLNRDKVCHLVCLPDSLVRQKLHCTSEVRFGENLSQGVWTQQSMSCSGKLVALDGSWAPAYSIHVHCTLSKARGDIWEEPLIISMDMTTEQISCHSVPYLAP